MNISENSKAEKLEDLLYYYYFRFAVYFNPP